MKPAVPDDDDDGAAVPTGRAAANLTQAQKNKWGFDERVAS